MCGIVSILSNNKVIDNLINCLKQLQNRGYDSAGLCTLDSESLHYLKYASTDEIDSIKKLENEINSITDANIGIAHTRWATHGGKTDINSHPHLSNNNKIAIVHNGIIENFQEIKSMLIEKGYTFKSQTDTEVISNLLEYNYCGNFIECIRKTIKILEGTYGLAILNLDEPNKLYCVRSGSPILVGKSDDMVIITSEQSGFNGLVNNYFILDSNDICEIVKNNDKFKINTCKKYNLKDVSLIDFDLTPDPYEHWTLKEIIEQIESSLRAISLGGRLLDDNKVKLGGLDENIEILKRIDNLILLGCGTSLNACEYGISHLKHLCSFNTLQAIDGAEFSMKDVPKVGNTALIMLSQSGETLDLYRCLQIGKDNDLFIISLVNVVDSLIARESDCGCYLNAGREVGVASTKSFINQCILLSMVAIWFSQIHDKSNLKRKQYILDLRKLTIDITNTIKIGINNKDKYLNLLDKNNMFILGKEQGYSIAKEGALKIKEITYIFTEGYSSSALKHGPFALLDENIPVIIISPDNEYFAKNYNAYQEIKSRNSPILVITDKDGNNIDSNIDNKIKIPLNKTFANLLSIIPIQLAAYYLSVHKGINPDRPRNLAKCVTVE